ncbi:Anti-sigma-D factor RsdA to sigma factor binding region [Micromonospora coriariae]|uniref:Anti-sigma-D factor RsdA to sigma factor binding region n=1 Tax=Micromonospora coriariae TaxID=285665 RepID=A0A1C4XF15_9ACTN|nr:anti-sigma-D factor RsdA [Micromonospora coriariae]SCF07103.1 Anti-sigma-D factor RsdA to sigma factor binding region [Micromonospora coriariae]
MSEPRPDGGEEVDLAAIHSDDLLLDALGRGEQEADADGLTAMLAAWRADVTADQADTVVDGPAHVVPPPPDGRSGTLRAGAPTSPVPGPPRWQPSVRRALGFAAAVVAVLMLATGLGVASHDAGPTSPLWSLTKVLHPERAEVLGVEHSTARARAAVAAGRYDEARELIDQAQRDLGRVTDPADATRLRADIDAVLRDLAALGCPGWPRCEVSPLAPTPSPGVSTAAAPEPSGAATPGRTAPAPARPAPTDSPTSGANPTLPRLPLPSVPLPSVPLPPVPLPSVLPSLPVLPLPTGDLLG